MSETVEETSKTGGSSKKLIGGILLATLAGVAVGNFVVAPRLGAGGEVSHEVVEEEDHGGGSHGKGGARQVRLDNLIVNPAGTGGSRFVVVTVVYELSDEAAETRLKAAEVKLRDAAASALEKYSLDALTRPGARDSLRAEFLEIAAPILRGAKAQVYLPQFLIQ